MAININDLRHPLQGGRSQVPSWARPDSSWNQIALEGQNQAYFQTTLNIPDANGKNIETKVEGILGFGPNGQPLMFGKNMVEHLLTDTRRVVNVKLESEKATTRGGVEYTRKWFTEI